MIFFRKATQWKATLIPATKPTDENSRKTRKFQFPPSACKRSVPTSIPLVPTFMSRAAVFTHARKPLRKLD